jgi:hypothetical protein
MERRRNIRLVAISSASQVFIVVFGIAKQSKTYTWRTSVFPLATPRGCFAMAYGVTICLANRVQVRDGGGVVLPAHPGASPVGLLLFVSPLPRWGESL